MITSSPRTFRLGFVHDLGDRHDAAAKHKPETDREREDEADPISLIWDKVTQGKSEEQGADDDEEEHKVLLVGVRQPYGLGYTDWTVWDFTDAFKAWLAGFGSWWES
jgi:hypothetical protein